MKNKGFTLIELLAVIVILAIIAIIATPIILNIVKDSKLKSAEISAENYLNAIEQAIVRRNMKKEFKPTLCTIISQGLDCEGYDEPLKVEVDGDVPSRGTILLNNGLIKEDTFLIIGNYITSINKNNKKITRLIPTPKSFSEDSWETIALNVKAGNIDVYKSNLEQEKNNTKTITLVSDDTNISGNYIVRIANTTTSDECKTEGFSQTACGFVVEFEDIIANYYMTSEWIETGRPRNYGGWRDSAMREYLNSLIYDSFPQELKKYIKETKVISGHGEEDPENFETIDKLYLLSPTEIYGNIDYEYLDNATDRSRQLDYYNLKGIKFDLDKYETDAQKSSVWWLRSACSFNGFNIIYPNGGWNCDTTWYEHGISPAFKIG